MSERKPLCPCGVAHIASPQCRAAYSQGYSAARIEAEGLVAAARELCLRDEKIRQDHVSYTPDFFALAAALAKWDEAKEIK